MESSQEDLIRLVEKAAFLHERRLPAYSRPELTRGLTEQATDRLLRWKKAISQNNDTLFKKRLQWDGLELDDVVPLLGGVQLTKSASLPAWANCLSEVQKMIPHASEHEITDYESSFSFLDPQVPVAFEHLLVPFVEHATMRLRTVAPSLPLLDARALVDLQRFLLIQLGECAIACLMLEFSTFRALRHVSPARLANTSASSGSGRPVYCAFVQRMWAGGLSKLFHDYPVLARLLAESTEMWVEFVSELLERLEADLGQLQQMFSRASLGKVARIQTGLSDRHNHGRVVLSLRFESGMAIVYKPKDLTTERAYQCLMSWLRKRQSSLDCPIYKGLYRNGYGWVEMVSPAACSSEEEVKNFYRRAGALLSLFHATGGNDFHGGNLFACGEYPTIIDMEALLTAELLPVPGIDTASRLANHDFWDWSVFRTAMLPRWVADRPEQADLSAGLLDIDASPSVSIRACESPNTDMMAIAEKRVPGKALHNVPHLNNQAVPASKHIEDIVGGFCNMYDFFTANKHLFFASNGPVRYLSDLPLRFVFRNTYVYSALIGKIRRPEYLRDGVEASIQAEALYRFLLHNEEKPAMWELVNSEVQSVLRGDVPVFKYRSTSTFLELNNGCGQVESFLQPAIEGLKQRFHRLGSSDQELQVCYIRSVFGSENNIRQVAARNDSTDAPLPSGENDSWKDAALMIARELQKSARMGSAGTVTWVTRVLDSHDQSWKLRPMDARLYDGLTGTALFLAALETVAGIPDFRELLVRTLTTLTLLMPTIERQRFSDQFRIGAGIGVASIIYGLAKIAALLNMEEALSLAQNYARFITLPVIKADSTFDLMNGAGGCILALLSLYKLTGQNSLLDLAKECGDHLLVNSSITDSGFRSWKTIQGKMLAGYSHGAAGIAHALAALHRATAIGEFRDAAIEACRFENSLFSKQKGNWPNLTSVTKDGLPSFWNTWCHGAVGIGLGRIACLDVLGILAQSDIDQALNTTLLEKFSVLDHPCCGNMGRVELFLCAGALFGSSAYMEKAVQIGTSVVRRAQIHGHYALGTDRSFSSPSFHQGTAGIGYQLLRLASPQSLPSVLLWQ